jgi:hypothetical protein
MENQEFATQAYKAFLARTTHEKLSKQNGFRLLTLASKGFDCSTLAAETLIGMKPDQISLQSDLVNFESFQRTRNFFCLSASINRSQNKVNVNRRVEH